MCWDRLWSQSAFSQRYDSRGDCSFMGPLPLEVTRVFRERDHSHCWSGAEARRAEWHGLSLRYTAVPTGLKGDVLVIPKAATN